MTIKSFLYELALDIMGKGYRNQYRELRDVVSSGQISEFIKSKLTKLLLHAYNNTKYYREVLSELGTVEGKVNLENFNKIPILKKDIIRKRFSELLSRDYKTRKWYYQISGGSTGEPVKLVQDHYYSGWVKATLRYYYRSMLGIDEIASKKVILWGSMRDIIKASDLKSRIEFWLTNTKFLNSFRMTPEDILRYIRVINSFKPVLVRGYAGALYEVCRVAEKKGIRLHSPKAVVSESEVLTEEMRELVETAFNTKVYNYYGSREVSAIAGECDEGNMHIFTFNNYLEVIKPDGRPAKEGEEGYVILTPLHNYSMPLIRYEIKDVAVVGPDRCKCGNPLPTLKQILGRSSYYFVKKDGTLVHGLYFIRQLRVRDWVKAFQVIQEDYELIRIKVVVDGEIDKRDVNEIEERIRSVMGRSCEIEWEFVDEIELPVSGKYLHSRSLIYDQMAS